MTVKQIQHLLGYLGYYTGATDGIWGDKSEEAAYSFFLSRGTTAWSGTGSWVKNSTE